MKGSTLVPGLALVASLALSRPAELPGQAGAPVAPPAATVVIDASDFVGEIQKGHVVTDAAALRVPWVFNNTALEILQKINQERGVTIVCSTHDHRLLNICDRIMWVRDGQVDRVENREDITIKLASIEGEH